MPTDRPASAFVRGLIQERDTLQRRIDELEALAAQERDLHDGDCCHPEDREWRRDVYRRQVCICDHGFAEHKIDTIKKPCNTDSCKCREFALCHTTVAEHRTVRETP